MSICISLIENGKVIPIFVKANSFLLKKYSEQIKSNCDKDQTLVDLWKIEFRAELTKSKNEYFDNIKFENDQNYYIFKLKFS
jgi:hypothetical protein